MKEAVIITQSRSLFPGSNMPPVDLEIGNQWNPFKKSRARKIKDQLEVVIEAEQLEFEAKFDDTYGNLEELKRDGAAFYILTKLVSQYVELEFLDEHEYIVLTEQEYRETDITRIVQQMKLL